MKTGRLPNVEEVLLQALKFSPLSEIASDEPRTGVDLIAVMQASPYKEIDLEMLRWRLLVEEGRKA